jgi:hypothetical protein
LAAGEGGVLRLLEALPADDDMLGAKDGTPSFEGCTKTHDWDRI